MKSNLHALLYRYLWPSYLLNLPRLLVKKGIFKTIDVAWTYNAKSYKPEILAIKKLIENVKQENELKLRDCEAYQLYMAVKNTTKIKGDIAEVGVFKGASAKIICEIKGVKKLHLFDTFEGLPKPREFDNSNMFFENQFDSEMDEVKSYLTKYPNVEFYKGLFPATAYPITNTMFSFVHLDVDLYESTLEGLKFFYPRMNKSGIIISHDYLNSSGVRKAMDEFFLDKPEPLIEVETLGLQCLVVKT